MSAPMDDAAEVLAPTQGNITAVAISTTANASVDLGAAAVGKYITMIAEVAFYVTFHSAAVTTPDETAVSGDGRTWRVPADTAVHFKVLQGSRHMRVKGSATGTLRYYLSSRGTI